MITRAVDDNAMAETRELFKLLNIQKAEEEEKQKN